MKAEIIGVGTELLLGHTINTDAAHVARELATLGIDMQHTQVVGDNASRLEDALKLALARSDIVITTGGLGPTADDLTKETVAKVAGVPLVEDKKSMAALKEYFGARPMTENQKKQAFLPSGSTAFTNPCGTAPGCAVPFGDGKFVIMLPGPPRELVPMLQNQMRPFLANLSGDIIHSAMIRVFGAGEGAVAEKLGSLLAGENPTAATYAGEGELFVRVSAKADTPEKARALAMPLTKEIHRVLGDVVYGVDVSGLEQVVVEGLATMRLTLATAESCTGGMLAGRITDIPGSSAVFGMGLVTYANEAKTRLLGVSREMLAAYGAVSPQVGQEMAKNVRRLAGADMGIGITGVAGPDGGTPEKPVGLVHICLAAEDKVWLRTMRPRGRYLGRQWTRRMATSHALDMVRRRLAGLDVEGQPW